MSAQFRQVTKVGLVVVLLMGMLPWVMSAKTFRLQNSSIVPGAAGEVKTAKDKNGNTKFTVQVKHLANPTSLTPPKSIYIIWIQQGGAAPESQGVLKVDKNLEGKFETATPDKRFDLWITAESDSSVKAPSGPEVLRANNVQP